MFLIFIDRNSHGKSVILTVVQKTIKVGATGENKKRF